jgi:radical SAM superfamily enzyme YgiQ (UPF0313 family)
MLRPSLAVRASHHQWQDFALSFPTETEDDIRETISFIFKLLYDNKEGMKDINIYTPYPGTELFDQSIKNGLNPPENLEDWAAFNWRTINRKNTPWVPTYCMSFQGPQMLGYVR